MCAIVSKDIKVAAEWLNKHEVVAIPTETVYGLAANIYDLIAVQKIYRVKNRPLNNPLIVHVADINQAINLVQSFPDAAVRLGKKFWPGPLTMVLSKRKTVPDLVTGSQDTVAIRVPDHPLTLALLEETGYPLAAPSANPFNYISPVTAKQVDEMLGDKIPYILDGGRCGKGIESTIIGFEENRVKLLREGAISREEIEETIGESLLSNLKKEVAHPGMFMKHYSPRTRVLLTDNINEAIKKYPGNKIALLLFSSRCSLVNADQQVVLSPSGNLDEAARNLYDALHRLDASSYDIIIAERIPDIGIGRAINDRLNKAAHEKL